MEIVFTYWKSDEWWMIYLNFTYKFKIMLLLEIKFCKSSNNNKKFVSWKDYSLASPKSQQKNIYI